MAVLGPMSALITSVGATQPPPVSACHIEGWSIDPDPTGLRVRAGPDKAAREIGRLPAFVRSDDGDYGPGFAVTGARGGWLRIAHASDAWRPSDLPRRTVFSGEGWVHGSRVRLGIQSGQGFAGPGGGGRPVVDIGRNWISDYGVIGGVLDCNGAWVKVAYAVPAGKAARGARRGAAWFTATCGDQRTTCDLPDAPRR